MTEVKPLSHEIRQRLPRIVLDFVAIILVLLVAFVVIPMAFAISFIVPVVGLSVGLAVSVIFLVILAILAVRILRDITVMVHHGSNMLAEAVPGLEEHFARAIARFVQQLRRRELRKLPGVAESIDWAQALMRLCQDRLDGEVVRLTLGCLLKDERDLAETNDRVVAELVAAAAAD